MSKDNERILLTDEEIDILIKDQEASINHFKRMIEALKEIAENVELSSGAVEMIKFYKWRIKNIREAIEILQKMKTKESEV